MERDMANAVEGSTYIIQAVLTDEAGNAVDPVSACWTLKDGAGAVVNSREAVEITGDDLASTLEIVLSGDDLARAAGDDGVRVITIYGTYYSTEQAATLPFLDRARFVVEETS